MTTEIKNVPTYDEIVAANKQEPKMKVFKASYTWYGGFGAFDYMWCVVIAEHETIALGLALESYPNTKASDWSVEELDLEKTAVYELGSHGN